MPRIKQAAQEMLNDVILPFWMSLKDPVHGGFYGLVDFDLRVDKTAEKGCILNSRLLDIYATRVYSPALHRQLVFLTGTTSPSSTCTATAMTSSPAG